MKIDIIGSVGAGETTLARELSEYYQIPYYEKDDIVWMRDDAGDYKRRAEDRKQLLKDLEKYGDKVKICSSSQEVRHMLSQERNFR
ncbi:hypothetical protein ACVRW7_07160 [Streptococcus ratti]|uniref:Topology modulation protein n=1 Tax=Streptococcus ratti FA-1 = DSM 20564 TaxID=699248 RepID=A0ABP2R2T4_STRRT|nr:hypothetical protein [Streptococcus ratti]EJN95117.1 hypothetical protein SRA_00398 [Streptococcus ratti FA-1 = DSM 20564]EMP71652.1 DNA topology modulation protein FlaR-related protein [Streptococcus ratti FA-1 = DSM 20564]QEY07113.1 hypothetical protein FY406_05380 [Streptococcus ratti]VEI59537.1 Uncharacterised protein [Streptococcus mutans]